MWRKLLLAWVVGMCCGELVTRKAIREGRMKP